MFKLVHFRLMPLAIVMIALGCVAMSGSIRTMHDPFDSIDYIMLEDNWFRKSSGDLSMQLEFNCFATKANDQFNLYISFKYMGAAWMFIPSGQTLVLLVDNQRIAFSGEGSHNRRKLSSYSGWVEEVAYYKVDLSQLKKIASAQVVEVRLEGQNSYATTEFAPKNFENIQRFIDQYEAFMVDSKSVKTGPTGRM